MSQNCHKQCAFYVQNPDGDFLRKIWGVVTEEGWKKTGKLSRTPRPGHLLVKTGWAPGTARAAGSRAGSPWDQGHSSVACDACCSCGELTGSGRQSLSRDQGAFSTGPVRWCPREEAADRAVEA